MLRKSPGFTLVVMLMLGIGIGANTAIFSVVNAVMLRPLPFREPERLMLVQQHLPKLGWLYGGCSAPECLDYIDGNEVFSAMAVYGTRGLNLTGRQQAQRIPASRVSANLFMLLGVSPLLGRGFTAEDDQPGRNNIVILSQVLWKRQFSADPGIVGQVIMLDEKPHTVVGVMPGSVKFPPTGTTFADSVELWRPLALTEDEKNARRRDANFNLIGRLKPGVTPAQARANMAAIAQRIEQRYPDIYKGNIRIEATAISLEERVTSRVRPFLLMLLGAVGLVLLIVCANVANLLLARAAARQNEMAIRSALGASRLRVVRQLLSESLLLALGGGMAGVMLAIWVIDLIAKYGPEDVPRISEVRLDLGVLGFVVLLSLATSVLFGLAPALHSARLNLNEALKQARRTQGATGREGARLRNSLVIGEIAVALVLLVGAGLLINSFLRLLRVPPGFNPEGVVIAHTTFPAARLSEHEKGKALYRQALERIAALPGVQSVGLASNLPLTGEWGIGFRVEGGNDDEYYTANNTWVS